MKHHEGVGAQTTVKRLVTGWCGWGSREGVPTSNRGGDKEQEMLRGAWEFESYKWSDTELRDLESGRNWADRT